MDPEKNGLPPYSAVAEEPKGQERPGHWRRRRGFLRRSRGLRFIGLACLAFIVYAQWRQMPPASSPRDSDSHMTVHGLSVKRLREDLATCAKLHTKPVDPIGLGRERNARYIDGHKPTLIKNATVWVGEPAEGTNPEDARSGKGYSWVTADVFLEHGLIKQVGRDLALQGTLPKDTLVYDAAGRPLTSGIIDMHSHAGVDSLPELRGNDAINEMSSDITPYVRAIDGIQPTDRQIQVIKSGGVTTSLVLPGSANNMGGEAFVIKHAVGRADGRNETSIADMLADPDHAWRYLKMACGENAASSTPILGSTLELMADVDYTGTSLRKTWRAWPDEQARRELGVPPRLRAGLPPTPRTGRLVRLCCSGTRESRQVPSCRDQMGFCGCPAEGPGPSQRALLHNPGPGVVCRPHQRVQVPCASIPPRPPDIFGP